MASLGKLVKGLSDAQTAFVAIGLFGLSCFTGGAATNHYAATFRGVPARVLILEKAVAADSVETVEWRERSEARMDEWFSMWEMWATEDSIFKWESTCVDRMQIEGQIVGRYDCKHETGDRTNE